MDVNGKVVFNTIDNGVIILNKDLNILAWNYWLEIRTSIEQKDIINKNICDLFPSIQKAKLLRKIKSVLLTKNPAFYSVNPHHYLIEIKSSSIIDKVYDSMQQDITIVPYDIENQQVCLYIYDKTVLHEMNYKLKMLNEDLKKLSNYDSLTQIFNRRYFDEYSKKMLYLSLRNNQDLSIVMVDIDDFKQVNDTYGHAVGDEAIILLAKELEKDIRDSDIVARFGGEEFVILLYNANLNQALKISDKLRKKVENLEIDSFKRKIKFTVSMGVAQFNTKIDDNVIANTIKRADDALYVAKNSGKNKVVKSEDVFK